MVGSLPLPPRMPLDLTHVSSCLSQVYCLQAWGVWGQARRGGGGPQGAATCGRSGSTGRGSGRRAAPLAGPCRRPGATFPQTPSSTPPPTPAAAPPYEVNDGHHQRVALAVHAHQQAVVHDAEGRQERGVAPQRGLQQAQHALLHQDGRLRAAMGGRRGGGAQARWVSRCASRRSGAPPTLGASARLACHSPRVPRIPLSTPRAPAPPRPRAPAAQDLQVGAPQVVVQVHLARVLRVGGRVGVEARALAALEVVDPAGGPGGGARAQGGRLELRPPRRATLPVPSRAPARLNRLSGPPSRPLPPPAPPPPNLMIHQPPSHPPPPLTC
jgi:hypothetical protein